MSDPWFVLHLGRRDLALKTLKRLGVKHAYPMKRIRRPRRPDLVEPVLGSYALVSFDPAEYVALSFPNGTVRHVPWPVLGELPGVVRIFHDGRAPLPVKTELTARWLAGSEEDAEAPKGFEVGRVVEVLDGPFTSFLAQVQGLTAEHRVQAEVSIFGRTSVQEFEPEALRLI